MFYYVNFNNNKKLKNKLKLNNKFNLKLFQYYLYKKINKFNIIKLIK